MTECFACGTADADPLPSIPDLDGLCIDCWQRRNEVGVEERLSDERALTPRMVAELQAWFHEHTETSEEASFTECMRILASKVPRTSSLRLGTAEELAKLAGIGGDSYYDGIQWPGVDPETTLYAVTYYAPLEGEFPLASGTFVAGETPAAVDREIQKAVGNWEDL